MVAHQRQQELSKTAPTKVKKRGSSVITLIGLIVFFALLFHLLINNPKEQLDIQPQQQTKEKVESFESHTKKNTTIINEAKDTAINEATITLPDTIPNAEKYSKIMVVPSNADEKESIKNKIEQERTIQKTMDGFKMVFFVGLEGVGHHLVSSLLKESPHTQILTDQLKILPRSLAMLRKKLFYRPSPRIALWSSFCNETNPNPNSAKQYNELVKTLHHIQSQSQNMSVTLSLNCMKGGGGFGMESYPNYITKCRKLTWPNLDILYSACQKTKLNCQQVYIYRDPASVMASTIRRNFNRNIIEGIHLYISHLYVIHAQLSRYHNKTISCHDFYDPSLSHEILWGPFRDLFGWDGKDDEFHEYLDTIYDPPTPMTQEDRQALLPSGYDMFMKSYYNIHNRVVNLCRHDQKVNSLVNNDHQLPTNMILPIQEDIRQHVNSGSIKIVLTIGLHGAGHSILSSVLHQYDPYLNELVQPLQQALYSRKKPEEGLLSMQCSAMADINVTQVYQNVVSEMKEIAKIRNKGGTIPLTFMSYPNSLLPPTDCQQLDYANMDVFYGACNDAGVDCEHVFIYRDPYSLIYEINKHLETKKKRSKISHRRKQRKLSLQKKESSIRFDTTLTSNGVPEGRRQNIQQSPMITSWRRKLSTNNALRLVESSGTTLDKKKPTKPPRSKAMPSSLSLLYYIHMYITMLYMIQGHFVSHPHRTGGCLNMNNNAVDNDISELWSSIKSIYSLSSSSSLESTNLKNLIGMQTPQPTSELERSEMLRIKFSVHMESIMEAHDKVIQLCREQQK